MGGEFSGRIVSYQGDKFRVILFTEDNFLAWKAEKKCYCINTGCTEIIEGKAWQFSYSFPRQTDTYWLVMLCENALMSCHLEADITWPKVEQPASVGMEVAVLVGAVAVFVCMIIGCAYLLKQCCKTCGKSRQEQEREMISHAEEEEDCKPDSEEEQPLAQQEANDEQEDNSRAALTETKIKELKEKKKKALKKARKKALNKEASV